MQLYSSCKAASLVLLAHLRTLCPLGVGTHSVIRYVMISSAHQQAVCICTLQSHTASVFGICFKVMEQLAFSSELHRCMPVGSCTNDNKVQAEQVDCDLYPCGHLVKYIRAYIYEQSDLTVNGQAAALGATT